MGSGFVRSCNIDECIRMGHISVYRASSILQDQPKIGRVIGCLKNTVQLPFVSGTESNEILTLYVHASFAVHLESNSHIGTCVGIQTAELLVTHWISYGHPARNKRADYSFEFHSPITLTVI